jgi:hypothetical protein
VSIDKTKLNIEVYNGENLTHAVPGTEVETEAWFSPYTAVVSVTATGVIIKLVDHDGVHQRIKMINYADLLVESELDEELKVLDDVQRTVTEAGIGQQPNPLHDGETAEEPPLG